MPRVKKEEKVESKPIKIYRGNDFIREFSEEVHGKGYQKLAEQFVAVRPDHQLKYDK